MVFTYATKTMGLMSYLYLFHIQCFFILPFLYGVNSDKSILERSFILVKRFYWPYFILVLLLGTIYGLLSHTSSFNIIGIGKALLFGGTHIKPACGVSILWFLPSMMCTMLLREIYYRSGHVVKASLLSMSVLYNVVIVVNAIDGSMQQIMNVFKWMPLGSDYAIGILYMGVITRWLYIKVNDANRIMVFLSCGLILLAVTIGYFGWIVPDTINQAAHPLFIIMSRFSPIVFLVIISIGCGYIRNDYVNGVLRKIGHKSLYIYLISPFVGYLIAFIYIRLNMVTWYVGLIVWPIIVLISYYLSGFIRGKVEAFMFPR